MRISPARKGDTWMLRESLRSEFALPGHPLLLGRRRPHLPTGLQGPRSVQQRAHGWEGGAGWARGLGTAQRTWASWHLHLHLSGPAEHLGQREAEAMRPGAARLQGWRCLALPLPLALTMRHELMGFGGPRPWKPDTRGDSIGKCGLWDGIGALTKEAPEGRARLSPPCADTARSGQSATRKGVSASPRSCERKTPVVYKPFHLWRHPETLWLPQPGEGAGTRGRANGISWAEARHPPGRRTAPHKKLFGPQHAARWGPGPVGVGAPATVSPWALRGACHVTGQLSERQPPPRRGRRLSGHGRGPSTGPGGGSAGSCPHVPTPPLRSLETPMSRFLCLVLLRSKREGVPGEPRQPGI